MAKSLEERIALAEENARRLRARKADQDRREDTRRKVLAGALLLHLAEQKGPLGNAARTLLRDHLAGFLKRSDDVALFTSVIARSAVADSGTAGAEVAPVPIEKPPSGEVS